MNEELRCKLCGRLLGKATKMEGVISIKCHRCGTITEFKNETTHYIVRTEEGDELGLLTFTHNEV